MTKLVEIILFRILNSQRNSGGLHVYVSVYVEIGKHVFFEYFYSSAVIFCMINILSDFQLVL